MNKEKQEMQNLVEAEKAVQIIRELVSKADLNIVENESSTGFSYFAGKKRLCKLLKTKRGVRLEINVELPKKFAEMPEMENISKEVAKKKHLGTMRHLYRSNNIQEVKAIMVEALKVFREEIGAEQKQEVKEA